MTEPSQHPKFVLTGVTGLRNHGVEALISTACVQLRKMYPSCQITVLTLDEQYDRLLLSDRAEFVRNDLHVRHESGKQKAKNLAKRLLGQRRAALEPIKNADLVIASGGDVFSSDYGALEAHLCPLRLALEHSVPVAFLGHSIGPFKTKPEADSFASVARQASFITARESLSHEYMINELGLSESQVHLATDVAFLLEPPSGEALNQLCRYYGLLDGRPTICMAVSQGLSRYATFSRADHLRALGSTANFIIEELQCDVLLVPHVQDASPANDDRNLSTDLLKILNWNPRVKAAHGHHSASEFKGLISKCAMVFAERMHAGIAGLGSGVPTMPIGYSVKSYGIMRDIIGDDYKGHVFDVKDWLDPSRAKTVIQDYWAKRDATAEVLQNAIPTLRKKAARNFELLAEALGQSSTQ